MKRLPLRQAFRAANEGIRDSDDRSLLGAIRSVRRRKRAAGRVGFSDVPLWRLASLPECFGRENKNRLAVRGGLARKLRRKCIRRESVKV